MLSPLCCSWQVLLNWAAVRNHTDSDGRVYWTRLFAVMGAFATNSQVPLP